MKLEDIKKVLIAGAGTMGQQTGLLCALNGYEIVIYDISMEILEKGIERIKKNGPRMASFYQFTKEETLAALTRISISDNESEAAKDTDLIIESIPEDPELKGRFFSKFHKLCKPETIFTTNTSSLVPSQFVEASGRPEKLCAFHFHNVAISKIVDIMPHSKTSKETIEVVTQFATKIDQIPIVLSRENNGYVFNNMLMAVFDSALSLATNEVASIEDIDRSWMGVMHTFVGPFGIMDSIGLETVWKVADYWAEKIDDPQAKAKSAFLKKYVDAGNLGIKTGQGFYTYPDPAFVKPDFLTAK